MGWVARRGWVGIVGGLACSPDSEEVGVVDEAGSSGTEGPSSVGDATTPGEDDDADDGDDATEAGDDVADDGDTAADDDDSTSDPGTTDAGEEQCIEEDWPACQVEACVQAWSFACEACPEEQSHPLCFGVSEGCEFPWLDCAALPASACGTVAVPGEGTIEEFEDEAVAICVLEALRDRVPGTYEITLGTQFDFGPLVVEVLVGADGSAVVQWDVECMNCFGGGDNGRTATMALQPVAFFEACLAAPTTESLAECYFGFLEYEWGGPPPDGWTPPFTTGECSALEFACPPG
jgi:hypothetical protein